MTRNLADASQIIITVDSPSGGAALDPTATHVIEGWALDPTIHPISATLAGVNAVHVYLNGPAGEGSFLGAAQRAIRRPDLAQSYGGSTFEAAGWRLAWRPSVALAAGTQTLYVYAQGLLGEWVFLTHDVVLAAAPAAAMAVATAAYTERRLGAPIGGTTCDNSRAFGYHLSQNHPEYSDNWPHVSQMLADAVLVRAGRDDALCRLRKGYEFLQLQWDDKAFAGGYFARIYPDGRFHGGDKYADDNALSGLALLAAAEAAPHPDERVKYLTAAEGVARFLMNGGLWDNVFEGGFWWNTQKGAIDAGKTGQTNAVNAFFFLRLHRQTGNPVYRDWGLRCLDWLDTVMIVPQYGGYRENIQHEDLKNQTGVYRGPNLENYIQSIAIEAWLEVHQLRIPGRDGLGRAYQLAEHLERDYWHKTLQNSTLTLGKDDVYTVYSAWITPAYVRLYHADRNVKWLILAKKNVEAIDTALRDEADGGYFHFLTLRDGQRAYDRDKQVTSLAWMQYALAVVAWPEAILP